MPRFYIISGCNGAGKTTASYTLLPTLLNLHTFVNADEIADELSPQAPERESLRAFRLMLARMDQLITRGEDFAVETTLATKSLAGIIDNAQQLGSSPRAATIFRNPPSSADTGKAWKTCATFTFPSVTVGS